MPVVYDESPLRLRYKCLRASLEAAKETIAKQKELINSQKKTIEELLTWTMEK